METRTHGVSMWRLVHRLADRLQGLLMLESDLYSTSSGKCHRLNIH